ncbi:MAG: hypothetical protein HQM08_08070 [Candidatus Riflebacteria bacterium]|nr:hypothetical protein [Candidatus Riflebacteria bacterium]
MKLHEKKRALFMGLLFPILLITNHLGFQSTWVVAFFSGLLGGLSVIFFPDPDRKP